MNNILKNTMTAAAIALSISAGASDIQIDYLGTNNTLVRVKGANRYLMLPVQESNEDAKVNVLVNGNIERSFAVRLAKTKVDYTVPFYLSPFDGKDVVLDIVSSQGRASVREAKQDACWSNFSLSDTIDCANKEKYRPLYHHTPEWGWMNDPNGMFYKDGVWHLCYQWNPYGSKWQNMTWGSSTSTDLIHWEHHPAAIIPNGLGMVFSGSSAIDRSGSAGFGKDAVVAMYTSAGVSQMQSLAVSHDNGLTYDIYPANPVITMETEARDPNMFWDNDKKQWILVLAHALEHEMLFFTSPDMKQWTLRGSFGKGLGAQGGVWECPDLFRLKVDGTDKEKWMLICNINPGGPFGGSAVQYFTGDFDGNTFKADTDKNGNVATKWLDYGKDNYALVSWSDVPDGRRVAIGWMSNWQYAAEVPTMQFRSANTLPREIRLFEGLDGETYASCGVAQEMLGLRGKTFTEAKRLSVSGKKKSFALPESNSGACEITLDMNKGKSSKILLTLSNKEGECVSMWYDTAANTFSVDRRKSGITDFSQDFASVTTAPVLDTESTLSLRVFVDTSSIEVFGNGGRFAITNLVFPKSPYTTLTVSSEGGKGNISNLKVYSLNLK